MTAVRKILIITFGSVGSQVTALLLGILLARMLPSADYGSYQQLILTSSLSTLLFTAALPASMLYFVPTLDGADRSRLIWRTTGILAAAGIMASLCLLLGRDWLAQAFHNPGLSALAPYFAPALMATIGSSVFVSTAIALGRSRLAAGFTLTASLVNFLALGGISLLIPGLAPLIGAWSAAGISIWLLAMGLLIRVIGWPSFGACSVTLREQLHYAIPVGLTSIVGTLAWECDKLLVGTGVDPASYALYVVGATEVPFIAALSGAVNSVLTPEFAKLHREGDTPGIIRRWHTAMGGLSLVYFPLFVFLMLEAGTLIPLVFSARYTESVPLFRIYLLLMPLRIATYGLIFQATGRTRYNLTGSVLYLLANLVLTGLCLKLWGLPGAAAGTVLATLLLIGYYLVCLRRELAMSLEALIPWRLLSGNFVPALISGGVVMAVARLWPQPTEGLLWFVTSLGLFGSTYLLLLRMMGRQRLAGLFQTLRLGPERTP